jgi:hypothetical protein
MPLFWTDVPPPSAARTYTWRQATGTDANIAHYSVAAKSIGASWGAVEAVTSDRLT